MVNFGSRIRSRFESEVVALEAAASMLPKEIVVYAFQS